MAETLVENRICYACGVDVREGALFCYNCGGAVTPEIPLETRNKNLSNTWVHQNIAEIEKDSKVEAKENSKPHKTKEKTTKKADIQEHIKMDSAAAMRRKPKSVQQKKVEEVVWEEYESRASGAWFVFVALILTIFAVGVYYAAKYLK